MMNVRIKPPHLYQAFMLCMLAIYFLLPGTRLIDFPFNLVGLPVFAFGAYMALAAKKSFLASGTPMMPSANPGRLHTDGWYRHTRNPMYLGVAIGLLGFAVLFSSYVNFLFPLLFVSLVDRWFIRAEEKFLAGVFGTQYQHYASRVRRWI